MEKYNNLIKEYEIQHNIIEQLYGVSIQVMFTLTRRVEERIEEWDVYEGNITETKEAPNGIIAITPRNKDPRKNSDSMANYHISQAI